MQAKLTLLRERYRRSAGDTDLDILIRALETALATIPDGRFRVTCLHDLARALLDRFRHGGAPVDLDRAIALWRDALTSGDADTDRALLLTYLGIGLEERFNNDEHLEDLHEAVRLLKDAGDLTPFGATKALALHHLASAYRACYSVSGDAVDRDIAYATLGEALRSATAPTDRAASRARLGATPASARDDSSRERGRRSPDESTDFRDPTWLMTFDWDAAGDDARDSTVLTNRLVVAAADRARQTESTVDNAATFGRYVESLRRARDWSRPFLAERARIDPLAVPLLELGLLTSHELTPKLVERIAAAFAIPVHELAVNPFPAPRPLVAPVQKGVGDRLREAIALAFPARLRQRTVMGSPLGVDTVAVPLLSQPVSLPEQHVTLPDGRQGRMIAMLLPGNPPKPGVADLRVRLVDSGGAPVAGVEIGLGLDDIAHGFPATAPDGWTQLAGLRLYQLQRLSDPVLMVATRDEAGE